MAVSIRDEKVRPIGATEPTKYRLVRKKPDTTSEPKARLRGFGPMAKITTSFGEVYAQVLREGDLVRAEDGRFLPIKKIRRTSLDEQILTKDPELMPMLIRRNSFGLNTPQADLLVAPDQPIDVPSGLKKGESQPARDLTGRPGILRKPETMVTYTTFSVGECIRVNCEGVWISVPA